MNCFINQKLLIILLLLLQGCTVLTTEISNKFVAPEGMVCYYLPYALIKVKATVKIEVEKDSAGKISNPKIIEASYEPSINLIADTRYVLMIKRHTNWFYNDALDIKVSNQGLLQTVNAISEDRTSNIVSALSNAPEIILGQTTSNIKSLNGSLIRTEIITIAKDFIIEQDHLKEVIEWPIVLDGVKDQLNCSFRFIVKNDLVKKNCSDSLKYDCDIKAANNSLIKFDSYAGLYSRPLKNLVYEIAPISSKEKLKNLTNSLNTLMIPDLDRIIKTPITRSGFVKKEYALTFADGVLIENSIKKPSEVEGFVTIPINIAKAIISIPAEIISFKINIQNKKTDLANADLKLQEVELNNRSMLLKSQIDAQKDLLTSENEKAKIHFDSQTNLLNMEKLRIQAQIDLLNQQLDWKKQSDSLKNLIDSLSSKIKRNRK